MPFIKHTMPDQGDPNNPEKSAYDNARHHDGLAQAIERVIAAEIPFLILTMPPRHGKSEQVSRRLPAFYLGLYPHHEVAVGTYSDEFAQDFGGQVRDIIQSDRYKQVFPETELAKDGKASNRLKTTRGGGAYFVGRGGPLTGRGAHLAIIDDLLKDDKEANSQAIRDQAWRWLTRVMLSRRRGSKLVIMTFTRWHTDDPIGRLTDPENPYFSEKLAKKIKVINLPAIAEDDDPLGRVPGEPLWPDGPDRFDLDFLEEMRAFDPLGFEALYQQRPTAADGTLFKRDNIRYYNPGDLPEELRIYAASDHAVSTAQKRDFTVMLKVGVDKLDNMYLLDCIWDRLATDVAVEMMLNMGGTGGLRPLIWWAEKGQIAKSIGPFLNRRMRETGKYLNIANVSPSGDKAQKAQSIAARVAQGKVFFPKDAPWVERSIDQMMQFPNGTFDDFVDTLALIGLGLGVQSGPSVRERVSRPKTGTLGWVLQESAQQARRAKRGFLNG